MIVCIVHTIRVIIIIPRITYHISIEVIRDLTGIKRTTYATLLFVNVSPTVVIVILVRVVSDAIVIIIRFLS